MSNDEKRNVYKEYESIISSNNIARSDIIHLLAHSIKSKSVCENQRIQFVTARTFPVGKFQDPTFVSSQTNNYIDCYRRVVEISQLPHCYNEFSSVEKCLDKNFKKNFPSECVRDMESYIKC